MLTSQLRDGAAQTRRQRAEPVDLLVLGGTIVTMDKTRRIIDNGGIAISNSRIVAVGPCAEIERAYTSRQQVNAAGKVITPGLINGHTHVPMVLFRGLADDLDLQEWLTKYIFPAEAKNVTEEFVRVGARLGLAEMIRGGTTTYCDMYYFEDAIADETAKAGVRGVLGETIIDFPVADNKTNAEGMAYVERFVARWKGHELIVPAIAPHAPYTVSEEHLKAVRVFSDRTGVPIVTHVSETKREVDDSVKAKGASPVVYLDAEVVAAAAHVQLRPFRVRPVRPAASRTAGSRPTRRRAGLALLGRRRCRCPRQSSGPRPTESASLRRA